jgi:hypothetical protein
MNLNVFCELYTRASGIPKIILLLLLTEGKCEEKCLRCHKLKDILSDQEQIYGYGYTSSTAFPILGCG